MEKRRIAEYDIFRVAACMLVIVGHATQMPPKATTELGQAISTNAWYVAKLVYAFHMPLFFMLSGACASLGAMGISRAMVQKRAMRLLLPYVVVGALFVVPAYYYQPPAWGNGSSSIAHDYVRFFTLNFGHAKHVWFLPTLFTVGVATAIMHKLVARFITPGPAVVVTSFVLYVASPLAIRLAPSFLPWIGLLKYWLWYALGAYALPCLINWQPRHKKSLILLLAVAATIFASCLLLQWFGIKLVKGQSFILPLIRVSSACFAAVMLVKLLAVLQPQRYKWFNVLVLSSMTLYLYHDIFNRLAEKLTVLLGWADTEWGVVIYYLAKSVGVTLLAFLVWLVVKRFKGYWKTAFGG